MHKKLVNIFITIVLISVFAINCNVYAATPSCYQCTQGATTFNQWDYNIDNSFITNNCKKVDNSNCSSTVKESSNVTTCTYKNSNGDTITYNLNHDTKTISNPPIMSYKKNCFEYVENQFSEYDSFVTPGVNENKAYCKYDTIYANVPSSYSLCNINIYGWEESSTFTLQSNNSSSASTTDNNSKYCLYKLSSDKSYFELASEGLKFTGSYDQYTDIMITVDLKNEKILTNNIESVLNDGAHFDANFTYSKLIDNYNKCTKKLYWNDRTGSSTIDDTKHESNPSGGSSDGNSEIDWGDEVTRNCQGILGEDLLDFINKIFKWIRIIAPIFVIVMGGVEYASAILKDDKDALNKANSRFIKRLIIAVALFFVPLVLQWLLNIFNEVSGSFTDTCGIGK